MMSKVPGTSEHRNPQEAVFIVSADGLPARNHAHNISLQTGEEFSIEFLHDRVISRKAPVRPYMDQDRAQRGGFNLDQKLHPGYADLTGILGLKRMDSECGSVVSNSTLGRGERVTQVEKEVYSDRISKIHKEASGKVSNNSSDGVNCDQTIPGMIAQSGSISGTPHGYHPPFGSEASDISQTSKMKFLCSFGGRILPRPSDGKLRYVGGETRIITIRKNLSWQELMQKTLGICNQPHMIKYQLPGEDLDALISVSTNEDLQNMIEEYHGLEKSDVPQRLRLFLISSNESESCSFDDARGPPSNSEYQYVVAVNGILDPSPRKSSSGQSQVGHNHDSSSFCRESPTSHPLDIKDGTSGMVAHHTAQFFVAAQNVPKAPTHNDSENALKVSNEDQFRHGGNGNNSFFTDQPPENSYCFDTSYRLCGPVSKHHPHEHMDAQEPAKARAVHFHDRRPSRDLDPPSLGRNDSDLSGYSFHEKQFLNERAFHSENVSRQQEDLYNHLSGSNDSLASHRGISHALSDSLLQERGGRSDPLEFSTEPLPLQGTQSIPQEGPARFLENREIMDSKFQVKLLDTVSVRLDSSNGSPRPEFSVRSETIHQNAYGFDREHQPKQKANEPDIRSWDHNKELAWNYEISNWVEEKDSIMRRGENYRLKLPGIDYHPTDGVNVTSHKLEVPESTVPASSSNASEACPDFLKGNFLGFQEGETTSKLPIMSQRTGKDQRYSSAELLNGNLETVGGTIQACMPSLSWPGNSEVTGLDKFPDHNKRHYDDEKFSIDLGGSSADQIYYVAPGLLYPQYQNIKDNPESRVVSSVNLVPDDASTLPFQNSGMDGAFRREISLLDQDPVGYPYARTEELVTGGSQYEASKGEDIMSAHAGPLNNFDEQIQLESVVIVEDVTDSMPPGIISSPTIAPHVLHEAIDDLTETESITPESECEDAKADDRDMGDSISDAAIAEIEAGIYGLQGPGITSGR